MFKTFKSTSAVSPILKFQIVFILIVVIASGTLGFGHVQAATNVGYKDFSMSGASAPTGQKPQSKLWFNDGIWWGVMYNNRSSSQHFEIYRFNWATDTWTTTGVMVDARRKSSADALWTGSKLYTVSNVPVGTTGDTNIYIMRFSYDSSSKTYSLDSGFPVTVYDHAVETVVMDKDTNGELWVTFTDVNNSGGRNAYVTHSLANDTTWGTPYIIPVSGANTLSIDDISTIVAYSGNIGVMWSNQNESTVYFAYHPDGTADNNWIANPAVQGPQYADDHLNIKSLQADSAGELFAVAKTSLNDVNPSTSTKPLVLLLQLDSHGSWSRRTVWRIVDNVTRPIVLLDQQNRNIYAFATDQYGTQTSGGIYYKSVNLDNSSEQFVDGLGTPFMVFSTDTHINNASSTKQTLNSITNLLVIAGDDTSHYYFHNKIVLGSSNPTATPTSTDTPLPSDTLSPTNTPTPTDTSLFSPTPSNTPTTTPTFTFTSTSTSSPTPIFTATSTGSVNSATVALQPDGTAGLDNYISNINSGSNFGSASYIKVGEDNKANNKFMRTLLKFDLSSIPPDATITSATLSLWLYSNAATNNHVLEVFRLNRPWSETSSSWNNADTGAAWQIAGGDGANDREASGIGGTMISYNEASGEKQFSLDPGKIQEMISGSFVNNGFILIANGELDDLHFFRSSDYTTASQRPKLVIQYTQGSTPTSTSIAPTDTPTPTSLPTATDTPTPGSTPTLTATSIPTDTPMPTDTPTATLLPAETSTPTDTPTATSLPAETSTPTDTPTATSLPVETPTPTATSAATSLFSDGFESGDFTSWTLVKTGGDGSAIVQNTIVNSGSFAAQLSETANIGSLAYIRKSLSAAETNLTISGDFMIAQEGTTGGNVPIFRILDPSGTRLFTIYRQNATNGQIWSYDGTTRIQANTLMPLNTWAHFDLHVITNGAGASTIELYMNNVLVIQTTTASLGTSGMQTIQVGNDTSKQIFELYTDNINIQR